MVILALETSCDDTCAAVVTGDGEIRSNVISSQGIHDRYGGVVPEIASRHHLTLINDVVDDALARAEATLDDVDLVAVTQGPGLVAALLIGLATGKAIAAARELPLAPVDHLHGHVAASFLIRSPSTPAIEPPFVSLIASGGHTFVARADDHGPGYTVLGQTLDDAAGEAFDKGARLLGLGYPGGPALQRLAEAGDPEAFTFPTGARVAGLDFSFAGLKTALLYKVRELGPEAEAQRRRADLAAAYQHAIVEALTARVVRALEQTGLDRLAIGGGVAANGPLRERLGRPRRRAWTSPPIALCTDNAAMIASAARYVEAIPYPGYLAIDVYATGERALGESMTAVVLYGRPGCHLCDDARDGARARARAAPVCAGRMRHRDRRRAAPRLPGADPGGHDRRRRRRSSSSSTRTVCREASSGGPAHRLESALRL